MPPKGKLQIGSNIGIDKEQAYKDRISDLEKSQVMRFRSFSLMKLRTSEAATMKMASSSLPLLSKREDSYSL